MIDNSKKMAKGKDTYTLPTDSQTTMASEPVVAYASQAAQSHVMLSVSQQFHYHYNLWIKETGPLSSPMAMVRNKHLQKIVEMGKPVVPYIVSELTKRPSMLYLALEQIFHERLLGPRPLSEDSRMCSWNPAENSRLWIEKLN